MLVCTLKIIIVCFFFVTFVVIAAQLNNVSNLEAIAELRDYPYKRDGRVFFFSF